MSHTNFWVRYSRPFLDPLRGCSLSNNVHLLPFCQSICEQKLEQLAWYTSYFTFFIHLLSRGSSSWPTWKRSQNANSENVRLDEREVKSESSSKLDEDEDIRALIRWRWVIETRRKGEKGERREREKHAGREKNKNINTKHYDVVMLKHEPFLLLSLLVAAQAQLWLEEIATILLNHHTCLLPDQKNSVMWHAHDDQCCHMTSACATIHVYTLGYFL